MFDTLFQMHAMKRNKIKIVLLVTSFICSISTSFGELNAERDTVPLIFNNEMNHLEYKVVDGRGSSAHSENQNTDNNNGQEDTKLLENIGGYENKKIIIGKDNERNYNQLYSDKNALCSLGGKWFKICEKENRNCELKKTSPYAECTDCKDGFVAKKVSFWGEECVEHCSSGSSSANKCKRLKRICHITKQKPFYECRCSDKLTEMNGKCVEYCTSGTESKEKCTKQNRDCVKLSKTPFFECGKCQKKFQESNDQCVEYCTDGTASADSCSAINKKCNRRSSEPFFDCKGCKEKYEEVGNNCIEYCASGTKSKKNCSANYKICQKTAEKPFFNCTGCLEGYILKNNKCIKYCDNGTEGQIKCSNSNRECHITKEPFYECMDCLDGFTEHGDICVEYCNEGTASEKKCSAANRECQKEKQSPFFYCGNCKSGFVELNNACVAYCEKGTESEKDCTALNRTCVQEKEIPFYTCGKCKEEFGEKDNKCLDYCVEGLRGYNVCRRQNKNCVPSLTGLFYKCTDCISGYILDKEKKKYCVDPCDEDEVGMANCSAIGRVCLFNPGDEYKCGKCNNPNWIEDGERCIDPCEIVFPSEENTTWSEVCENANASCKYDHALHTTGCICHEKDTVFNWKTKSCGDPCDLLFPNEKNATWSEICGNANATCKHDYKLNETSCTCFEENNVFNMSTKSCLDPCLVETDGIIWADLCAEKNATCVLKNHKDVTCKCKHLNEAFDEHSKTCKELHPCDLPQEIYPCKNKGICENINEKDYKCNCDDAWYGNHCEHKNLCSDDTLCHPANCSMDKDSHTYSCICKDNEYFNYERKICEEIACFGKSCSIFRECQNGRCVCKEGFEEEDEECKMTDEECESQCGRENVICVNVSSPTEFTCMCKEGYYLNSNSLKCEESRCVFPFHPCEQICNVDGDELCSCLDGFRLVNNYSCEIESENLCKEKTCENGKCIKSNGKELCVCNNGFMELNDSQCIDICGNNGHDMIQSLCPNGCTRKNGEIKCICTGKYIQASDGISCVENNYCLRGNIGEIECHKLDKMCTRHDEDPWFKCICPKGLRSKDGGSCTDSCSEEKIQECALTHQTCKYSNDVETCHCPSSMTFDKKSNRCQFAKNFYHVTIDVKVEHPDTNIMFSPTLNEKIFGKSFSESMKLLFGSSLLDTDVIECSVKEDFHTCTFSLTFGENADGVINRLQHCKTLENSTENCIFPPNLIVSRKSLETVTFSRNKCDERVKKKFCPHDSNICNPMTPGYSCLCKQGFSIVSNFILGYDWRYKFETCEDIDECKNNPCWKNSKCENTYGSFICICEAGYVLNNAKDGCQGVCDDNPCGDNGKCKLLGDHGYECECNKGYKGTNCMEEDAYLKNYIFNTYVIGTVLGIVLLISVIVIILLAIRLYKNIHDAYDLRIKDGKNKYEISMWLQMKEIVIKKEYNGVPDKKEKF